MTPLGEAMKAIGATVEAARESWSSDEELLEAGICLDHLEEHDCHVCHDGGRVRLPLPRSDRQFGKSVPCPACAGQPRSSTRTLGEIAVAEDEFTRRSRIPATYLRWTLNSWGPPDSNARLRADPFVTSWPPPQPVLVLSGPPGRGKTGLAIGVMREVWRRWDALGQFWPVADLLARYRATMDDEAEETVEQIDRQLARVPLLVLDDYGAHKSTDWTDERMLRVVDQRYREGLPLVLTTNLGLDKLGERELSRLTDSSRAIVVSFQGPDRRAGA